MYKIVYGSVWILYTWALKFKGNLIKKNYGVIQGDILNKLKCAFTSTFTLIEKNEIFHAIFELEKGIGVLLKMNNYTCPNIGYDLQNLLLDEHFFNKFQFKWFPPKECMYIDDRWHICLIIGNNFFEPHIKYIGKYLRI